MSLTCHVADLSFNLSLSPFFSFGIGVSPNDPTRYQFVFSQGGMPFRTKDLLIGPTNVTRQYMTHVTNMWKLAGDTEEEARDKATRIVQFETAIANITVPPEELRFPERLNNPMSVYALSSNTSLDFFGYLSRASHNFSLSPRAIVNVHEPIHFMHLSTLMHATPLATLHDKAKWNLLLSHAADLPRAFGEEYFSFFGRVVSGTLKQAERWRVCQAKATGLIQDAVDAKFIAAAFSDEASNQMRGMIRNVQLAFLQRLPGYHWMSTEDALDAANKLSGMVILVGANRPDQRLNYTNVSIHTDTHFDNVIALRHFNLLDSYRRMKKPVDRTLFQMPASQVNAYYDPSLNSMNFPAGIIQPPFFHPAYPSAWNYGGLGSVVGHELTHGFDDEGRKYDRHGRLAPWWDNSTTIAFNNATECLVHQYEAFPLGNITATVSPREERIRGRLTLGENLADQGGIALSYTAWKIKKDRGEGRRKMKEVMEKMAALHAGGATHHDGHDHARTKETQQQNEQAPLPVQQSNLHPTSKSHTDTESHTSEDEEESSAWRLMQKLQPDLMKLNIEQLFFLAYGQAWCRVMRPESFLRQLQSDPHSPALARVNVPINNFQPFQQAFNCTKPIDQTFEQCTIW